MGLPQGGEGCDGTLVGSSDIRILYHVVLDGSHHRCLDLVVLWEIDIKEQADCV